jgi:archaellum component FlaC
MSDQKPNYKVELERTKIEKETMELNLHKQKLRLLEIDDEKERIYQNFEASKKSISDMDKTISELEKTVAKIDEGSKKE